MVSTSYLKQNFYGRYSCVFTSMLEQKRKKFFCYQHKLNWENAFVNSIENGPFTNPNKALVNTLQIQLSEDLQVDEKTENHTGNQKKATFLYAINNPIIYMQVFQRLY